MESHVNVAKAFNGFLQPNQLKDVAPSASTRPSELGAAVQKFEAFFIQSMLKSMRSASLSSGLLDSDKSDFYRDWHDQQLASDLASKETFAVAKLLRRQFESESDAPSVPNASLNSDALFRHSAFSSIGKSSDTSSDEVNNTTLVASVSATLQDTINPIKNKIKQLVTKEISESTGASRRLKPSTPEQFVQQVYPHAQSAATKLNTSADVLIAIAALETGWGLHTPKANYGEDSFNYFGIKANSWQGSEVTNVTKEFDGEKMVVIEDDFRAYETAEDSFKDFAEFLLTNPRYQNALNNSGDSKTFVNELQKAGYATDPNYANKINSILDGSILKNAIHSLHELNSTTKAGFQL